MMILMKNGWSLDGILFVNVEAEVPPLETTPLPFGLQVETDRRRHCCTVESSIMIIFSSGVRVLRGGRRRIFPNPITFSLKDQSLGMTYLYQDLLLTLRGNLLEFPH